MYLLQVSNEKTTMAKILDLKHCFARSTKTDTLCYTLRKFITSVPNIDLINAYFYIKNINITKIPVYHIQEILFTLEVTSFYVYIQLYLEPF